VRDKSTLGSCILNIQNGNKRFYPVPVANVDRRGRYALSINFSRMFDFRPGYGYAGKVDTWKEQNHPDDDGIYLLDFRDGSVKLIISLQQIWEFTRQWLPDPNRKLMVNHITFNPSSTRFVALVRYFPVKDVDAHWRTIVITANTDGSEMRAIKNGYIMASHYHWKNEDVLMIWAAGEQGNQLYEWNNRTGEEHVIDPDVFLRDGHCSYSPDGSFVLYDSYPDKERYQQLFAYNLADRETIHFGKLYSYERDNLDIRCDLHPRWSRAGDVISLDSNHEGSRHIYELEI
jgi:Tol biopolymer transport system component